MLHHSIVRVLVFAAGGVKAQSDDDTESVDIPESDSNFFKPAWWDIVIIKLPLLFIPGIAICQRFICDSHSRVFLQELTLTLVKISHLPWRISHFQKWLQNLWGRVKGVQCESKICNPYLPYTDSQICDKKTDNDDYMSQLILGVSYCEKN